MKIEFLTALVLHAQWQLLGGSIGGFAYAAQGQDDDNSRVGLRRSDGGNLLVVDGTAGEVSLF